MKANAAITDQDLAAAPLYRAISLRIQLAVLAALDAKAQRKGMTRTSCVIDAINDWLKEN